MKIGGLQKLTLLDYPGLTACTVFLSGCNFRCPFCHNASLVLPERMEEGISEEEFFAFLKKRQGLLDGVCVTGGEPFIQEGLPEFLGKIKALGYKVKTDTNGSFPEKLRKAVEAGLTDYVAMDVKNSREYYAMTAGTEQDLTDRMDESIRFLLSGKVTYEFRTTVVEGFHDERSMRELCRWIEGADRYFIQNFRRSEDIIGVLRPDRHLYMRSCTKEELHAFLEIAREYIKNADIRGE